MHITKIEQTRWTSRALDGFVTDTRWAVMDGQRRVATFDRKRDAQAYIRDHQRTEEQ